MKPTLSFLLALFFAASAYSQAPTITGDLLLCPNSNGTATITNNQTYDSYTWYWKYWFTGDPYVAIPGANGPSFTYDWMNYDQALLKVVVTLGGNTYESNAIQIDSYAWVGLTMGFEDTETDNISIDPNNGNVLLCQGTAFTIQVFMPYNHVQWYKDGLPIVGANSMEFHVTEAGSYHVVASPDFCPDSTDSTEGLPIIVEIDTTCGLGIPDPDGMQFSYYPNPVKEVMTISPLFPFESVSVYNLAGQMVYEGRSETTINLSSLSSGMYLLKASDGEKNRTVKIMKE